MTTPQYLNDIVPLTNISYTPFNKVKLLESNIVGKTKRLDITYGPTDQRYKSVFSGDSWGRSTYYSVTGLFELKEEPHKGIDYALCYIYAGDGLAAICRQESEDAADLYYVHKDHLGSYDVITNETGEVVERMSFDVWGRRRNATNWSYTNVPSNFFFDRGYTGHEHLDAFGLINMNGRVYDPTIGRFMSADPIISDGTGLQGFNRYSYCTNNPLKYTDPSGYRQKPYGWNQQWELTPSGGKLLQLTERGAGNHWSDALPGSYSYSWRSGLYLDNRGSVVSYETVFNNYIQPNSSLPSEGEYAIGSISLGKRGIWLQYTIQNGYDDLKGVNSQANELFGSETINRLIGFSGSLYKDFWDDAAGQGGSNPFTLLDAAGGLLTLEDGYNNFFHNHTTYTTTKGITKNIYKANGAVRSARAEKFATTFKIVKGAGVAGTALMTGVAFINIVDDISKGNALSGKDVLDFSVGSGGLLSLALVANPVSLSVVGGVVAVYSLGSFAYDLYTTDW